MFSIPNPLSQANVYIFFKKRAAAINKLLKGELNSLTEIENGSLRCLKIKPHHDVEREKFKKLSKYGYIVYLDISRFYHSIYTHSLPWAAHGKSESKKDPNPKSTKIFFNKIDQIIRNGQDGQTLGIPVGPDSSRVLAEIINVAIDNSFRSAFPEASFLRHVDDIWIGAQSESEAREYFHAYREKMIDFELDANENKTKIQSSRLDIVSIWPAEIGRKVNSVFELSGQRRIAALLETFQSAFEIADRQKDQAIVKFLIRKMDINTAWSENESWSYIESFLMQSILHYPHTTDYVTKVLVWRKMVGLGIDESTWSEVFSRLIQYHARMKNDFEITWILWAQLKCKIQVKASLLQNIIQTRSDLNACLSFLLWQGGLVEGSFKRTDVKMYLDCSDMLGSNWLFAHELRIREWLPKSELESVNDSDFHQKLRESEISFIQEDLFPAVFLDEDGDVLSSFDDVDSAIEDTDDAYDDDEFGFEEEDLNFLS